jgi:hypothetical protein
VLRLEVLDWAGPTRWRWRLTEADGGAFVADHQVELDAGEWQFEAFTDLHRYLKWNAVPDRRLASEAELAAQVGEWIGNRVLGRVGGRPPPAVTRTPHYNPRIATEQPPSRLVPATRPLTSESPHGLTRPGQGEVDAVAERADAGRGRQPVGVDGACWWSRSPPRWFRGRPQTAHRDRWPAAPLARRLAAPALAFERLRSATAEVPVDLQPVGVGLV